MPNQIDVIVTPSVLGSESRLDKLFKAMKAHGYSLKSLAVMEKTHNGEQIHIDDLNSTLILSNEKPKSWDDVTKN